jgi:hypothetical protein
LVCDFLLNDEFLTVCRAGWSVGGGDYLSLTILGEEISFLEKFTRVQTRQKFIKAQTNREILEFSRYYTYPLPNPLRKFQNTSPRATNPGNIVSLLDSEIPAPIDIDREDSTDRSPADVFELALDKPVCIDVSRLSANAINTKEEDKKNLITRRKRATIFNVITCYYLFFVQEWDFWLNKLVEHVEIPTRQQQRGVKEHYQAIFFYSFFCQIPQ